MRRSSTASRSRSSKQKAAELRADWAWAKAVLDPDYGFLSHYRRIEPQPAEYPPEIAAELDRIEARLEELGELPEEELGDDLMMEAARLEERRDEIIETTEAEAVYSEADRKRAGVIVTIGDEGGFLIHQGLIERAAPAVAADTGEHGDGEPDGDEADDFPHGPRTLTTAMPGQRGRAMSPEQQIRKQCGFSQGHIDDLKAYRLQITRAYLAGDFAVAFDLALYALCSDLIDRGYRNDPLDLRATETPLRSTLNDLAGTPADRLLTAREAALDTAWLDLPPAQAFAALSALPMEAKQRLFAWCVALTLKPQLAIEDGADPVIEAAGRRLAIPFADLWRPDAANYWGRVARRTRSRSRKTYSARAGRAITSSTGSRFLPRRSGLPSIPTPAPPRSISRRCAIKPPRGCRPASPMPKPPSTPSRPGKSWPRNPAATRRTIRSRSRPARMPRATTSRPF